MSWQIYPLHYEATDKVRYSPAQKRVRYQVSPSYASTTLTPYHSGSQILIGYRPEGLLTAENPVHRWTGKYLINK